MKDVEEFRSRLDSETLAMIDCLRAIIMAAQPSLAERIKWNAPSFAIGDDDRITLGLVRNGGVRLVLHRGSKPLPVADFAFDDPDSLANWPSPDRGVIVFKDLPAIKHAEGALTALCSRWIDHTRSS